MSRCQTAAPQAPLALPRARLARHRRRRRHLRRPRPREARPEVAGASGPNRAPRGARRERRPRSRRGRGRARQALRPSRRDRTARSAAGAAAVGRVPPAVRSAGLGPWPPRLAVRVRLRLGALPPAGQAAVGLVRVADPLPRPVRRPHRARESTALPDACRCSGSGGRRDSSRSAPTGSSTRCAMRWGRTCASPASTAPSGRRTSTRNDASSGGAASCYRVDTSSWTPRPLRTWPTRGTGGPPGVPALRLPPQRLAALCTMYLYA
jgi:hypothetical protein